MTKLKNYKGDKNARTKRRNEEKEKERTKRWERSQVAIHFGVNTLQV
jgi:hypothetical protein